jgi:hypothetical protein
MENTARAATGTTMTSLSAVGLALFVETLHAAGRDGLSVATDQ